MSLCVSLCVCVCAQVPPGHWTFQVYEKYGAQVSVHGASAVAAHDNLGREVMLSWSRMPLAGSSSPLPRPSHTPSGWPTPRPASHPSLPRLDTILCAQAAKTQTASVQQHQRRHTYGIRAHCLATISLTSHYFTAYPLFHCLATISLTSYYFTD